jgi:transcriptional regulator with XRE-family HTH domain
MAAARKAAGHSQESLARALGIDRTTHGRWEQGLATSYPRQRPGLAKELKVDLAALDELLVDNTGASDASDWVTVTPPALDDIEAIELIRRAEVSDVGPTPLAAVENGADLLCRSYTSTPPAELLVPLRAYRSYAVGLLDGRTTLAQRRQLTVTAGWLSLLAAICHVDLRQHRAAALNLEAARSMADEADDSQLVAWVIETFAWQALTDGLHHQALALCEAGVNLVVEGTSAHVQLTVQAARASALLGLTGETHRLLDKAAGSLGQMPTPDHPEHHFQFDPRKLVGYTATTLVWLGEDHTAAEDAARAAVAQYDIDAIDGQWVRRLALARVDLALVLAAADQPDEAVHLTHLALDSGRVVPSNLWRLTELDHDLGSRYGGTAQVADLHDRYLDFHRRLVGTTPRRALGPG